jgi:hypothetical protein
MKNFKQYKILGSKGPVILLVLFFLIQILQIQAQHISNNGAYISITTGTFIGMDSIKNYNNATLVNNGTLTLTKFNNSAAVENNETLASATINNSGTFQNTEMITTTNVVNTLTFGNTGTLNASNGVTNAGTFTNDTAGTITAINTVTNSGTFTNRGDFNAANLENMGTSTFDNTGTLNTSNSVTNAGTFTNDTIGTLTAINTITNSGTFTNGGDFNAVDVENTETSTFDNTGTINASNSLTNAGTFSNENTGTLTAINTVTNARTFTNKGDFNAVDLENTETSTFDNIGIINASNSITNAGTFTNDAAGTLTAINTVTNSGTFTNGGDFNAVDVENTETSTFDNTGTLTADTVDNSGTFTNDAAGTLTAINTVTNSGTFTNGGNFNAVDVENMETSTFDNTGTLTADTVDNSGTFTNDGSFTATEVNNVETFGNTGTLIATTVINSGAFENLETLSAPTVTNSGIFANSGSFNATDVNNTLTFGNTGTLLAINSVINAGTFENLNIFNAPTVDNSGTFTNDGSFTATIISNAETFENTGTLTATTVTNSGTFENLETFSAPTVTNSGTFANDGSFTATEINNTEVFGNTGTLTASTLINSGAFANMGIFSTTNLNNSETLENMGTLNVTTFINEGNTLGDGTYNIVGDFTSSGTFFSAAGAVYMNGTSAQIMTMETTTFNNLTINNTASVTLISTQTVITNNLTINTKKVFKIEANKNITVTGTIDNYGGTSGFILKSNSSGTASLLHDTPDVPVTLQRYITGIAEDWHFLSAPVSNQSISGSWNPSGTYGNGTGYDLYIFNEPTPCWTYQLNTTVAPTWPSIHPTANFVTARGYLYSTQAPNPTKEFVGLLNNGAISYPITNESPDLVLQGFNLIGNPYPSSIDWKSINGWSRTNLIPSGGGYDMWIWNQAANNYGVYNSNGDIGTNGVTQHIAPAQGYFIRAVSNGDISLSNAVRVHTGASNWLKGTKNKTKNLKIRITSSEGDGSDEVLLLFGYPKNEAGAVKLFSQNEAAPSAYLHDLKKDLSVRYLTDTIENSKVPLYFKAGKDGGYSLSFDAIFGAFNVLLLEDKKNNSITDLNVNAKYEFKGTINDDANRFVLHFKDITEVIESLPVPIFYDGNEVNVDLTLVNEETNIKVFDMLGRLLLNKKGAGKTIHRFNVHPKHALYIIVATSKEKSSRKVVLVY